MKKLKRLEVEKLYPLVCETLERALEPGTDIPNRDGYVTALDLRDIIIRWQEDNLPDAHLYETDYDVTSIINRGIIPWLKGQNGCIMQQRAGRNMAHKGFIGLKDVYMMGRQLYDTKPLKEAEFEFMKGALNFRIMSAIRNCIKMHVDDCVDKARSEARANGRRDLTAARLDAVISEARPSGPIICYEEAEDEFAEGYEARSMAEQRLLLVFANAIIRRRPLLVTYKPLNRDSPYRTQFHPHYIRRVNRKLMVYGESLRDDATHGPMLVNLILRRVTAALPLGGVDYIGPEVRGIDYNQGFFRHSMTFNTHRDTAERDRLTEVVLKVVKVKTSLVGGRTIRPFERLLSEPLHHSQRVLPDRDGEPGYGFLSLKVNDHLFIKPILLAWGGDIEVLEPEDLRQLMAQEVQRLADLYGR